MLSWGGVSRDGTGACRRGRPLAPDAASSSCVAFGPEHRRGWVVLRACRRQSAEGEVCLVPPPPPRHWDPQDRKWHHATPSVYSASTRCHHRRSIVVGPLTSLTGWGGPR